MTALFSSPVYNWLQTAHAGLAAFIVGVLLVGIYLWSALKEGYWGRSGKQSIPSSDALLSDTSPSDLVVSDVSSVGALPLDVATSDATSSTLAPSSAQLVTIEDTLDELLVGKIARDEASARMRVLLKGSEE